MMAPLVIPFIGANPSANAPSSSSTASAKASGMIQSEDDEATLPEAVTDEDEDGFDNLQQKLAKGEEENVAGTYFKSERASKLVAEAKEVQKGNKSLNTSSGSINLNSNLSSSFNSGLNTVGVNNFHLSGIIGGSGGRHKELPAWFGSRGPFHTAPGHHGIQSVDVIKKPARLEALPQDRNRQRKRTGPGPILNTMGTF